MRKTILSLTIALAACGGGAQPPSNDPPPRAADDGPPGPLIDDPTFELRATAGGPYAAGTGATFEIRLTPKGRYHVNQDYPMAVTLAGPDGVRLPDHDLGPSDAAEFREQLARFAVPFTPQTAGRHRVTARVDFAVCTPEACMPDLRTLAIELPVQ